MPKISIIVPVYNMEQFLGRCLDSILSQTFQDFEVLLVNDGSTDNSGQICREYARKDPRIVLIDKENGGLSSARNSGLDAAKAEYVGFVDSDDHIAPDMYQFLYQNLVKHDADISICSFYFKYEDGRICHAKPGGVCRCMNNEEAIRTLLGRKHFENYVWDKLYKKVLFDGIRFPENELYEDIAVTYRLLDSSKTVIYESEPKYYYVQRPGSIVNSGFSANKLQFVEQCRKLVDFSKSRGGLYDREARTFLALASLWLIYEAGMHKSRYFQILTDLKNNILNNYDTAMQSRDLKKSERLALYLLKNGMSINVLCGLHWISKKLLTGLKVLRHKIENLNKVNYGAKPWASSR